MSSAYGWSGTRATINYNSPAAEKNLGETKADGQKGRGFGGRNFCPLVLSAPKARLRWERFRNSSDKRKAKQKNFRFLN